MKENWTYKKLGDVCSPKKAIKRATKVFAPNDEIAYIDISSIDNSSQKMTGCTNYILSDAPSRAQQCVQNGDIIVSTVRPNLKNIAIVDFCDNNLVASSGFCVLRPSNIERNYLFHFIISDKFTNHLMGLTTGANYPAVRDSDILDSIIPIPPLSVQQSIVAELDEINNLLQLKKKELETFDKLAQSIFYEMFGDPVTNEKKWVVKKYGDEFEIGSGGTPSKSRPEYWENGNIPWIGSNMCQNCIINNTDGKYITEEGLSHSSAKLLDKGTIIVALVGATIGKTALLNTSTATNQNIAFINVTGNEEYNSYFVFYHMMSLYDEFMNIGNGDFKMANLSFVRSLPIIKPSLEFQQTFAQRIEAIEQQKEQVKASINKLETLLASRMQYWFD